MSIGSVAVVMAAFGLPANAQSYFGDFHNHNAELKAVQPTWVTPLVGTTPLLGQFVREEFVRQRVAGGNSVWNIGNGKGLSLVFFKRVETDLSMPNYVVHGSAPGTDGLGDFCVTARVRIASGNKEGRELQYFGGGQPDVDDGVGKERCGGVDSRDHVGGGQGVRAVRGAGLGGSDDSGGFGAGDDGAAGGGEYCVRDAYDAEVVGSGGVERDVLRGRNARWNEAELRDARSVSGPDEAVECEEQKLCSAGGGYAICDNALSFVGPQFID
jgi:hypothetical protein